MPLALTLTLTDQTLAIVRLAPDAEVPAWLPTTGFTSVTRTPAELSIVCDASALARVDAGTRVESGWAAFEIEGPLDFSLTGVLSSLLVPLADAKVAVFAVSTFDTDYVLVKHVQVAAAASALQAVGHEVRR